MVDNYMFWNHELLRIRIVCNLGVLRQSADTRVTTNGAVIA